VFHEPERYTPSVARERRLENALKKHQENIERQAKTSVSGAKKKYADPLPRSVVKDRDAIGPKAATIAAALATFSERDFSDPNKRAAYRDLRRQQELISGPGVLNVRRNAESGGGQERSKPSGADLRYFSPRKYESGFAGSTIYGTVPRFNVRAAVGVLPRIRRAMAVVPCVQRAVRREVLFATGKGGKGYRTPHRRNANSGVPC
jgi:hypothetical protein